MESSRILIAPDKFKGSLTSFQVADAIGDGIQSALKNVSIEKIPLADGGDGFVRVATKAMKGRLLKAKGIPDALGRLRTVEYGWEPKTRTALLEAAGICGIASLKKNERNALKTSSYGLGLMVRKMLRKGAREILIGLGGSATNDGGVGFASALGYEFLDVEGNPLTPCGGNLLHIREVRQAGRLKLCRIRAAVDVTNPLLGKNGATCVFGPQKGATPQALKILEKGMANLSRIAGNKFVRIEGAGAAGGLGYGVMTFANAKLVNGFGLVAELTKLEQKIKKADVVITGEGCLDSQTATGKLPEGVRRLALKHGKRIFALVGTTKGKVKGSYRGVYALTDISRNQSEAIRCARRLLMRLSKFHAEKFVK